MVTRYISRYTGKPITEIQHVLESIVDILTTPKGTRPRLMEYGTTIYQKVDHNITPDLISDVRMEIATALDIWEKRVRFNRILVNLESMTEGKLIVWLEGTYVPSGEVIKLEAIELMYRSIAA